MGTRLTSPVFVGRLNELTMLAAALDAADERTANTVLVGGEAGVGKSRLLEEFFALARARGAVVAVGNCVQIGGDALPLAPIATALRDLIASTGRGPAPEATEEARALSLVPSDAANEVDRTDGGLSVSDFSRTRLFDSVRRLVEERCTDDTLILAIEDLHWADRSTRELLAYLSKSLRRHRILLILTYRNDEIHRGHPLGSFVAETERQSSTLRWELSRFERDEVAQQLDGILGAEATPSVVDRIFERSDGNAFFVEELAAALRLDGDCDLPRSLRDLVLIKVEQLPEATQGILRTAAAAGAEVEYELLAAVTDLDDDVLLDGLRAAVTAQVLMPGDDGHSYRFRHALVREAIQDELLPGERTRMHARYAEVLQDHPELVGGKRVAARVARHWHQAHDPVRTLPAALAAADEACHAHAHAEQLDQLERAMAAWKLIPKDQRRGVVHVDLVEEAAGAARLAGRNGRGLSLVKEALRHTDDRREPVRAARLHLLGAVIVRELGRSDGRAELARARELLADVPVGPIHARVLWRSANVELVVGPSQQAADMCREAIAIAEATGDESTRLAAMATLGSLIAHLGDPDEGVVRLGEVLVEAEKAGDAEVLGRIYTNLSDILDGLGRHEQSAEVSRAGLAAAQRLGFNRTACAFLMANLADACFASGRWDEAERVAADALDSAPDPVVLHFLLRIRAGLALARGQTGEAAALVGRIRRSRRAWQGEFQSALPVARLGIELAVRQGDFAEAQAAVAEALTWDFPPGSERYAWPLLAEAARTLADGALLVGAAGLDADSRSLLADRVRWRAAGLPTLTSAERAWAATVLAECAGLDVLTWREAVAAWEDAGEPYLRARALVRAAEAEATAGNRPAAATLLATAVRLAEPLQASAVLADADLLARRARLDVTRPASDAAQDRAPDAAHGAEPSAVGSSADPSAADPSAAATARLGLTPREEEVLRLVADGHTNRQIASRLYISVKTASVHVSNILAKLGVSHRGEAAAVAHRLRLFEPDPGPAT